MQAFYAGLHKRDCPKQWDWCAGLVRGRGRVGANHNLTLTLILNLTLTRCAGHAIVCAAGGAFDLNCTENS